MPTGRLAVWWVVGSEIVIFGGLLAAYIMYRLSHAERAGQSAHTNVVARRLNPFILLRSRPSAVLPHKAAETNDGPTAA